MALFGGSRDASLFRHLNKELIHDLIDTEVYYYKLILDETKVNLYGEAAGVKYYDGPFLFNCLIDRTPQSYPTSDIGVEFLQTISFAFLRDDLVDANVVPEIGDIILYQDAYYGVQSTVVNQYFVGKNPDYPNNANPLNPGLENFGSNISIICDTYYIPADKVAISPYKERT